MWHVTPWPYGLGGFFCARKQVVGADPGGGLDAVEVGDTERRPSCGPRSCPRVGLPEQSREFAAGHVDASELLAEAARHGIVSVDVCVYNMQRSHVATLSPLWTSSLVTASRKGCENANDTPRTTPVLAM